MKNIINHPKMTEHIGNWVPEIPPWYDYGFIPKEQTNQYHRRFYEFIW